MHGIDAQNFTSDRFTRFVKNLDRGVYHQVARLRRRDPSVSACAYLSELAAAEGLVPAPEETVKWEEQVVSRLHIHPQSRLAMRAREWARKTWTVHAAIGSLGLRMVGPHSDVVEKFFASSEATVLFPAWVEVQAGIGQIEESLAPALITQEFAVDSHLVQHVRLTDHAEDRRTAPTGQGARAPAVRLRTADTAVALSKYQAELQASYEALRLQRIHVVALFIQRLGAQLGVDETDDLLQVALAGDGNAGSAAVLTPVGTGGTVTYADIVKLSLAFPKGYRFRAAVLPGSLLQSLLTLAEFKDPQAGFDYQATGQIPTFLGADWYRWSGTGSSAFGTDRILALDTRHALVQYTEGGLLIETDRLIDRQWERTVLSKWTGFGKLDYQATQGLDVNP